MMTTPRLMRKESKSNVPLLFYDREDYRRKSWTHICWSLLYMTRTGFARRTVLLLLLPLFLLVLGLHLSMGLRPFQSLNSDIRWSSYNSASWIPALDLSSYTCPENTRLEVDTKHPWTLHQVLIPPLTLDQSPWQKEWIIQGYPLKMCTSVDSMRSDVERLVQQTGDNKYVEAFEQLPRLMEKIDMWKYVILYLEGGMYADMDVAPTPCLAHLMKQWQDDTHSPTSSIFFYETSSLVVRFSPLFRLLMFIRPYAFFEKMNWDTTVRIPQFRSALILAKTPGQEVYKQTLDLVVQRTLQQSSYKTHFASRNQQTLEVTGPGCFSDAIHLIEQKKNTRGKSTEMLNQEFYFIKREDCNLYFDHIATGSWREKPIQKSAGL